MVLLQENILHKSLKKDLVNVDQLVACMIFFLTRQKNKLSQVFLVLANTDPVGFSLMDSIHIQTNLSCDRLYSPPQQSKNCTFNTTNFGQLRMWMLRKICFLPMWMKKTDSSRQNWLIHIELKELKLYHRRKAEKQAF